MLAPERAERLVALVEEALAREPAERAAFLEAECNGDPALRAEAESLLRFEAPARALINAPAIHVHAETFLAEDDNDGTNGAPTRATFQPGELLGDYRILSLLGEGGMGEVYLADDLGLERQVAVKLIKRGMATAALLRNFRQEKLILAGLNHPGIARLYGGALAPDGSPYLVMEYVEGERLDEFCAARSLGIPERLHLFRKVCAAVAYAHSHLVIHRDLKPANIRVTPEGEPKLLDFGIAKLLDAGSAPANGAETLTQFGAMTPDYASPEQVRGEAITTASDVYSLGVVLYELLTGQRPYRLTTRQPLEIARQITERIPAPPSAAARGGVQNPQSLRGDLDVIVLKALRKEPERRYGSVAQFSDDVRRHLEGLPVLARKDTFRYRAGKFIGRHRVSVAAAGLLLLSLVGGMAATAWQAHEARQEKSRAQSINTFLEEVMAYANPHVHLPRKNQREMTMTDVLDGAAKRLEDGEFADQPELKAELERILGASYLGQGKRDLAMRHFRRFVAFQSRFGNADDSKALPAAEVRAWLSFEDGKLAEAESEYRRVLPKLRAEQRKGRIKPETLVDALNSFGYLRRTQGDPREAEALFREMLALRPQLTEGARFYVGLTRSTLASTLADQGRFDEALATSREAVAEYRASGQTDVPDFGFALTILGGFLTEKGDYAEADASLQEAETILRELLSPSTLWRGDNLRNQAASYYHQGRFAEALDKATEALKIYRENFGPHYDQYPTALVTQGLALTKLDQPETGERILREALKIRTDSLPPEHFWVALAKGALGECLAVQRRDAEAEPLLRESYESLRRSQGADNPRTQLAQQRLARLREDWVNPAATTPLH